MFWFRKKKSWEANKLSFVAVLWFRKCQPQNPLSHRNHRFGGEMKRLLCFGLGFRVKISDYHPSQHIFIYLSFQLFDHRFTLRSTYCSFIIAQNQKQLTNPIHKTSITFCMELQLLPYAQSISRIHNKPTQIIAFLHHEYKFIWPRLIRYQHSNTETMTSKTPSSGTEAFARTIYINKTLPRFIRHSAPYLTGSCYITSGNKASSRGHGLQLHNSYHKVTRICGNSWKKK